MGNLSIVIYNGATWSTVRESMFGSGFGRNPRTDLVSWLRHDLIYWWLELYEEPARRFRSTQRIKNTCLEESDVHHAATYPMFLYRIFFMHGLVLW